MGNQRKSKLLSVVTSVIMAVGILAGSIAVPILCRPFYYAHMEPLQMSLRTALTDEQIKETYNEIIDYCLGMNENFRLSHLAWSTEGAAHFADVRTLFLLDLAIAGASLLLLGLLWVIGRRRHVQPAYIKGYGPGFWAGTGLIGVFLILACLAAINFDQFFTLFHQVFFPGKENWIFNPATDPVIKMLPQVFFRNCALLVFGLLVCGCVALILWDRWQRKIR